ncbi:MAG: DUF4116 domain-containing protein [Bacilli bacterium]
MKYNSKYDIGKSVKLIFDDEALDILKVMSSGTWIREIPIMLIELINGNYDIALKSVRYTPNIYFHLNDKFKNDKQLIRTTIKSFRKHNRISEINIKIKPLTKREEITSEWV